MTPAASSVALTGISSMATRALLAELLQDWQRRGGTPVTLESVGGVDAARRVASGEPFDLVVLASDAIDRLVASGQAADRRDLVRSRVAVAVRTGAPRPDIRTEAALQAAVREARSIGYSTGPSGTALMALFERWGLAPSLRDRLVQARPGLPVGSLVAQGEAELGFQQFSELMHLSGVTVLGPLPPGTEIDTLFSAARCTASPRADEVRALVDFLDSPQTADAKRRHGMSPAHD